MSALRRRCPRGARRGARPLALAVLVSCIGCEDEARRPAADTRTSWALEETFSGGPVHLTLRLDHDEIPLAGRVVLEQELEVEGGFEADFPEYLPEDFEGMTVVDIETPRQDAAPATPSDASPSESSDAAPSTRAPPAATERSIKRLVLEPDRSGEVHIAPLEVWFRAAGEEKESSFRTSEIAVRVAPIEDAGSLEVGSPPGIIEAPPLEDPRVLLWSVGGAGGAIALGLFLWLVVFRKREKRAPPPVPAHEVAWDRLRRLVAADLVAKGEIEEFFAGLASILREYIGNRFAVRAPELTTPEFFEAAAKAPELGPYRERLREFLDLSDRVRFARFEPDEAAIQDSFDSLKRFVEETTPDGP